MATSVFMFASPCRAPRTAAARNRRPKTNWTMVAGMRNQRLTSIIGHGGPPGQNITAIIAAPTASDARALKSSSRRSAARSSSAASTSVATSADVSRPTSYPAASMAATIPARSIIAGSKRTVARSVARLTFATVTPSARDRNRSMRLTQLAQVIPTTGMLSSAVAGMGVGVVIGAEDTTGEYLGPRATGRLRRAVDPSVSPARALQPRAAKDVWGALIVQELEREGRAEGVRRADRARDAARPVLFAVEDDPATLELLRDVAIDAGWSARAF